MLYDTKFYYIGKLVAPRDHDDLVTIGTRFEDNSDETMSLKYGYSICRATDKWSKPAAKAKVEHRMFILPNALGFSKIDGYWNITFGVHTVRINKDLILVTVLLDILYNQTNPAWIDKILHQVLTDATEKLVTENPEFLELVPNIHTAIQLAKGE